MVYCVAAECKNGYGSGRSFFQFPNDADRRAEWVRKVRAGRKKGSLWVPSAYSKLCSDHFESDCFEKDLAHSIGYSGVVRPRLKADAIPTVFAPKPVLGSTPKVAKSRRSQAFIKCCRLEDEVGASSAGADSASSSVTDPVWSGQGKTLGRNQEIIVRGCLRSKKIKTEQNFSDECLDGNEPEVYIDVAEHPEDSSERKHSLGDDDEFLSMSDRRKYIKSEDGVGVKIEISQEYLFDELSREQNIEKNGSDGKEFPSVSNGKPYIKSEYDVDVKTEISQEYLSVESLGDQDTVKDRNEVDNVNLTNIKQEPGDEVIESNR